ncbi:DNA-formamidopyrimidine glycosylase family protein [Pedobacter hartonius]|uniref:Formamidopyrimidine-DNA glycosylase n=1 Tax=Pedobacter hartonius TaxID=425514 RepID=A0A1H3WBI7_9SPHI|nr:DNA-formamidopyrimidine glycosylase family protein [Pedobacter hartonius]SDZ83712.1 formamidopyrimidine-DNA glycosylase [Pedobacter hartonius]
MPELPDLEVFSHNLSSQLKGKQVKEVLVPNTKKINVSAKELQEAIDQQKIEKIYRRGKEIYFEFENKALLSLHMMLNGELHISKEEEVPKYAIIRLGFKGGLNLTLTDFRGLANGTLNPEADNTPDALAKEVNTQFFQEILANKKAAIKNILLDQHVIRGIGNAYADEILWEAGISPFSAANKIPGSKLKALSKAVRHVLENAVKQIQGSKPGLISGEVRDFLKIHNPKKTHSPSGVPIQVKKTGARKTYFTDEQETFT